MAHILFILESAAFDTWFSKYKMTAAWDPFPKILMELVYSTPVGIGSTGIF
jgi:hypothetical protein